MLCGMWCHRKDEEAEGSFFNSDALYMIQLQPRKYHINKVLCICFSEISEMIF